MNVNVNDNDLFIILDTIEKTRGWGLFLKPGVNRSIFSQFMQNLEDNGFIKINGKTISDNKKINYMNLEFTVKGKAHYNKIKQLGQVRE